MLMNLLRDAGMREEAVLLATGDHRMRVVVRGRNDALELRFVKGQWMSEEGDAVDIESLISAAGTVALPCYRGHAA